MRTAPSRAGEAWQEGAAGVEGLTSTLGKTWPFQGGPGRGDADAPLVCTSPRSSHRLSHAGTVPWTFESDEHRRAGKQEDDMALFMDAHTIEGGVSASDVAEAHRADLATQGAFGVSYRRYWVDEAAGKIFCLVEAPDAGTANSVHREAHGLVADEIYEVSEGA